MNLRRTISAAFVSTFALSGCSTSYAPRPNPRVAVVMQGGTPVYIREGRVFPGGGFGGDLREAVEGNAEAESHAKSYRTSMIAGVTTALTGVASAITGGILYASSSMGPDAERNGTQEAIGGTLAVGGIAAYVTGMVLMLNAQPHLWDAINAYNDGVENSFPSRAFAPPMTQPPYASYTPSAPTGVAPTSDALIGSATARAKTSPAAEAPSPPSAAPAPAAPSPTPEASPSAAPAAPVPDLDLDAVEAK